MILSRLAVNITSSSEDLKLNCWKKRTFSIVLKTRKILLTDLVYLIITLLAQVKSQLSREKQPPISKPSYGPAIHVMHAWSLQLNFCLATAHFQGIQSYSVLQNTLLAQHLELNLKVFLQSATMAGQKWVYMVMLIGFLLISFEVQSVASKGYVLPLYKCIIKIE